MTTIISNPLRTSLLALALATSFGTLATGYASAADKPAAEETAEKPVAKPAADKAAAEEPPAPADFIGDKEPPSFPDPDKALAAFKSVVETGDVAKVAELLGLDPVKLESSENSGEVLSLIQEGVSRKLFLEGDGDTRTVIIGTRLWPFPFPLKKFDDGWAFDTYAGIDEIVDRRVGENEINTMDTMRGIVQAQDVYADEDHDGDGVLEFAQKLVSSEGKTDGLYWPADQGSGDSPAGAMVEQAQLERAGKGQGYYGYKYKVLKKQGDNVAGGAYDYVINGNMIAGHAVVAWPVKYGETGVHTFVINQYGVLYEKDLGDDTVKAAEAIDSFNPDDSWDVVED